MRDRPHAGGAVATAILRDKSRGRHSTRGRDATKWQRLSLHYRKHHPLCEQCARENRVSAAHAVDHIVPHRGRAELLFDTSNLQSLCETCHNAHKQSIERRGYDKTIGIDGFPSDNKHPFNQKIIKDRGD